jgi:hypothetical protein
MGSDHKKWINESTGESVAFKENVPVRSSLIKRYTNQMGYDVKEFEEWWQTGKVQVREDVIRPHVEEEKPEPKEPERYKPTDWERKAIIEFAKDDEPLPEIAKAMLLSLQTVQDVVNEAFKQALAGSGRQARRS